MGSSLFEQNLSGSAFRRGLPLPREIRLTGIILSSSLSLFLSRWVKNRPVNCHDALTACQGCEQASDASRIFAALIESAQKGLYHLSKNKMGGGHFRRNLRRGRRITWARQKPTRSE